MSAPAPAAKEEEAAAEPPECFICTESVPAPRRSACKCTDRYVHDACLVKMLETSTHDRCPVCLTPYANVACKSTVVAVRACSPGVLALALIVVSPTLLWGACATWRIYCCSAYDMSMAQEHLVIIAAIAMAMAGGMGIAHLGNMCVAFGPTMLARSVLVHTRSARVLEVLPPRLEADEFGLAERHTR